LSATPILHKDSELLALLHLLDPQAYSIDKLKSFSAILQKRQILGRKRQKDFNRYRYDRKD